MSNDCPREDDPSQDLISQVFTKEAYTHFLFSQVDQSRMRHWVLGGILNGVSQELSTRSLKECSLETLMNYRLELMRMAKYEQEWQVSCMYWINEAHENEKQAESKLTAEQPENIPGIKPGEEGAPCDFPGEGDHGSPPADISTSESLPFSEGFQRSCETSEDAPPKMCCPTPSGLNTLRETLKKYFGDTP